MARRVCAEPGCPELTDRTRCTDHTRARDKARGTAAARGYGVAHRALRSRWQHRLDRGVIFHCWRCGVVIDPNSWTLGHCDIDRTIYHGPECPPCDYATAGRAGCPHPSHN